MKASIIEGQKIYLRSLNEEDVHVMTNWVNNQNITQYLNFEPPISEEEEHDWLIAVNQSETDLVFGIVEKGSNSHIGNIGLHHIDQKIGDTDIGIFIGEVNQQGKGYGTEALQFAVAYACRELRLKIIHAPIFASNARSIALFEKVGFKKEKVIEKGYLKNGNLIDVVMYAYLCSGNHGE